MQSASDRGKFSTMMVSEEIKGRSWCGFTDLTKAHLANMSSFTLLLNIKTVFKPFYKVMANWFSVLILMFLAYICVRLKYVCSQD